jgi:hypothetical protein
MRPARQQHALLPSALGDKKHFDGHSQLGYAVAFGS